MVELKLRAVEPGDAKQILAWENEREDWQTSGTQIPYSLESIYLFIENQQSDIYISKQVRLIIDIQGKAIGCVDLFDFDPSNCRAGVGILIEKAERGKGYALKALLELEFYARRLHLHQLYAHIAKNNLSSLQLFTKASYRQCGELIDWIKISKSWENAILMQKILE